MAVAADHADAFVGDLVAVAERAIADEPARERVLVKLLVHWWAPVCDSGRYQNRARRHASGTPGRSENTGLFVALELGHKLRLDLRSIFARLVAHPLEQLGAFDAVREA